MTYVWSDGREWWRALAELLAARALAEAIDLTEHEHEEVNA